MLKTLTIKQLSEIFRAYMYNAKKGTMRSKKTTIIYFVLFILLMIVLIGGMFTALSIALCEPLVTGGASFLYFVIFIGLSLLLGVFGTVFNTYQSLYLAKDNEMLLSLPIKTYQIVLSRIFAEMIMAATYSLIVIIPSIIVYFVITGFTLLKFIGSLILCLCIVLVVIALSSILGYVIAKLSKKLKNNTFATVLIALLGIGLYYFLFYRSSDLIEDIINNAFVYGTSLKEQSMLLYRIGSIATGDILTGVISLIILLLINLIICYILQKSFIKIALGASEKSRVKERKPIKYRSNSLYAALVKKEFAKISSSANYILNVGMGGLFSLIFSGAIIINQKMLIDLTSAIPFDATYLFVLVGIMITGTILFACCSISLEAKTYWILKSLPIDKYVIIKAKMTPNLIIVSSISLLFALTISITFKVGVLSTFVIVALILSYCVLNTLVQMTLGVFHPNMVYTNEIMVIKRGFATGISLLFAFVYVLLVGVLGYLLNKIIPLDYAALIFVLLNVVASALLIYCLKHQGVKRLEELMG